MNIEKLKNDPRMPKHVAYIIDGNGRWAKRRGLPRSVGHKFGMDNVKKQIEFAEELGIKNISIYAFSTENWNRSKKEVDYLMELFDKYMDMFKDEYLSRDVRIVFSGDINDKRIPESTRKKAAELVELTKHKTGFVINNCINYGGRQEILKAVNELVKIGKPVDEAVFTSHLYTADLLPLDLIIRTSGEQRTSNFMPWQSVYSEYYFPKEPWPSFNKKSMIKALKIFMKRDRRFGKVKEK